MSHTLKETKGLCPYFIERTQVQIREDLRARSHGQATQGRTDDPGAQVPGHSYPWGPQVPEGWEAGKGTTEGKKEEKVQNNGSHLSQGRFKK